jgi:TolB-like protein/class 3 adenylate cyclase/Flp pilus assembly protein TadD
MAPRAERKLAAILAADVVGYSRLVGHDEAGTVARLKALRKELIEPLIADYRGRIVKLMGDGALVEFASAVDAVECAVAVQRGVAEREAAAPEDRRIQFRVGVNVGDIIVEDGDILGDGVNIAARLEALAAPGEVCVSRTVHDHARAKVAFGFEAMGEHRVKNIAEPVTVYRVIPEPGPLTKVLGLGRAGMPRWRLGALAGSAVALLVAAGGAGLWLRSPDRQPAPPDQAATPVTASTAPVVAPQAPFDKRRLAVLPFANISADPEDEYFSDGMTEEMISKLSRLHDLTVIARTSVMQYKRTGKGIAEIGRELQAGTILEGSVRKAGDRLRITAQLVDVASQGHLWSQDYDRELTDVFAIQSDVAEHVAEALQLTLKPAEKTQLAKSGTADVEAYNAYLQGLYHYSTWSKEGFEKSIEYFQQAIARDPNFAKAHAAMAFSYEMLADAGYLPPGEGFPKVKQAAHRSLELDATTAEAYTALAIAATYYDYDWIRANEGFHRALELNPNSAVTHEWYSIIYLSPMGRHEEAIAHGKRAKELDPLTAYIRSDLAWAYNQARRYDEAIAECEQIRGIDPDLHLTYSCLGFAYWQKGMLEQAVAAYERGVELEPGDLYLKADLAIVYAAAGRKDQAQKILEEFEENARREYVSPYALAMAHMAVGDLDGTFAWLDKMYEERTPWLIFMNVHPRYDGLRGDPRWHELMRKIGFTEGQIDAADALAGERG